MFDLRQISRQLYFQALELLIQSLFRGDQQQRLLRSGRLTRSEESRRVIQQTLGQCACSVDEIRLLVVNQGNACRVQRDIAQYGRRLASLQTPKQIALRIEMNRQWSSRSNPFKPR